MVSGNNSVNRVLRSLPTAEYERLLPHLELVSLQQNDVLSEVAAPTVYGYFLESGLVTGLTVMNSGQSVEVGMIGSEGFAGLPILLNIAMSSSRLVVQISGDAMRIRAEMLHRLLPKLPKLKRLLSRFAYLQTLQMEQIAACNVLHEIEPRMARWLLMVMDRVGGQHLQLTQEQISRMLGTRRASVTIAAISLQKRGAVEYERGSLHILNRRKLEEAACECHKIVHAHLESYFQPSARP
jgi:CRP-like cAMP-binding protein